MYRAGESYSEDTYRGKAHFESFVSVTLLHSNQIYHTHVTIVNGFYAVLEHCKQPLLENRSRELALNHEFIAVLEHCKQPFLDNRSRELALNHEFIISQVWKLG